MIFRWYQIFALSEFLALGLVSKSYNYVLDGVGEESLLVTQGNTTSVCFRDVMIPLEFNGENPTVREGELANYALYLDGDLVYLGIEELES